MTMTAEREAIFAEIDAERIAQDVKWGGPAHDDQHDYTTWNALLTKHAQMAGHARGARAQWVRVAALAVAAIEAYDRTYGHLFPPQGTD